MLIEFTVGNFRSIKEPQTLSFVATPIKEHQESNTFMANDKMRLLKSAGIYGANGSGKSNLVKAMWAMLNFITSPFDEKKKFNEHIEPFKANLATRTKATFFQIVFMAENKKYRYGFEYQQGKIVSEWLFGTANKSEVEYFTRENKDIYLKDHFKEAAGLEKKTREDNLLLNVAYEFAGEVSSTVFNYLSKIEIIKGIDKTTEDATIRDYSMSYLSNETDKKQLLAFLNLSGSNIEDIDLNDPKIGEDKFFKRFGINISPNALAEKSFNTMDFESIGNHFESLGLDGLFEGLFNSMTSKKSLFDEHGNLVGQVNFEFDKAESEGTKRLFNYAGVILNALKNSSVLIIDEFDARFHAKITKTIVQLFNSSKNKAAQLFFVTHDTNLLDNALLRRDQIYFSDINLKGETSIFSLADFNGVRNDASFEKEYLKGKYGAIPYIGNIKKVLA